MERISACLIVYNEEKLIARCLASLQGVVDEIIVVHDGECTDKTLEIAKEYGARIFVQPHIGFCEAHKSFCYQQASSKWILQIDADEFLSVNLRDNLKELISHNEVSAYNLFWPLWNGDSEIKADWPYKTCLFQKDKISFLGIIHFMVEVEGKIKKVNYKLCHQPSYNNFSFEIFFKKQLAWVRLQASYYLKDFSEIEKFNWTGSDWPKKVILRRKYPLLLIPLEFFVTVFKNLFSGAYKAGFWGLKVSLIAGFYRSAVNYYLYKLKK